MSDFGLGSALGYTLSVADTFVAITSLIFGIFVPWTTNFGGPGALSQGDLLDNVVLMYTLARGIPALLTWVVWVLEYIYLSGSDISRQSLLLVTHSAGIIGSGIGLFFSISQLNSGVVIASITNAVVGSLVRRIVWMALIGYSVFGFVDLFAVGSYALGGSDFLLKADHTALESQDAEEF